MVKLLQFALHTAYTMHFSEQSFFKFCFKPPLVPTLFGKMLIARLLPEEQCLNQRNKSNNSDCPKSCPISHLSFGLGIESTTILLGCKSNCCCCSTNQTRLNFITAIKQNCRAANTYITSSGPCSTLNLLQRG